MTQSVFLVPGVARRFFALVAHCRRISRLARLSRSPTQITVLIQLILPRLEFCWRTTTQDLGLQLLVLHSELVLLQRRTGAATATAATATTMEEAAASPSVARATI